MSQEMLAERDAKIRELEETVRLLKEKLTVREKLPEPARPRMVTVEQEVVEEEKEEGVELPTSNVVETIIEENSDDNMEEEV